MYNRIKFIIDDLDHPSNIFEWLNKHCDKTLQELRMLSNVTLNCQVTEIFMNLGSQLSEFRSWSQKVSGIVFEIVQNVKFC